MEDLVVIVLTPPNVGLETRKLPAAINVAEMDGGLAMGVSFVQHLFQLVVLVFLVCYTHLIVASHFVIARPNPFARANEMLRLDAPISEEVFVGCHGDELVGGHAFPNLAHYSAVIELQWLQAGFM